ncbi:MAG: metal-sensing transcriptional repressor [Lachnospiraceae bacterium]|nr:metal-sensing transcriptional repressor [Lachnospiraceae bacterium]
MSIQNNSKHKARSDKEYQELMNRLKRIEGQVRGLQRMLEEDAYCIDILTQAAAVNAAINSFNKNLLAAHIQSCVADNIRKGNDEVIDELVCAMQKLMK